MTNNGEPLGSNAGNPHLNSNPWPVLLYDGNCGFCNANVRMVLRHKSVDHVHVRMMDYATRTHHTNMDVFDRLVPEDLRINSVILASFLYNAAMRDELLPRENQ